MPLLYVPQIRQISIHAPRAGSDPISRPIADAAVISIHAPRAGSDLRPRRRRRPVHAISIHAPRAGSDRAGRPSDPRRIHFNPCSPCGERRLSSRSSVKSILFQSMLPVRGATHRPTVSCHSWIISIHAPRAGSDVARNRSRAGRMDDFNPCSPCGERQGGQAHADHNRHFNPCSPCGERRQNQTKYGLYFGKIAEVSDRQQQRFGMYEVKHERLERLQGHFEKFRGANGRRIF